MVQISSNPSLKQVKTIRPCGSELGSALTVQVAVAVSGCSVGCGAAPGTGVEVGSAVGCGDCEGRMADTGANAAVGDGGSAGPTVRRTRTGTKKSTMTARQRPNNSTPPNTPASGQR